METFSEINDMYVERFAFIEMLSREFVAMTGCGVYVYLNPLDVDQLFNNYQNLRMPIRAFARQCIKNVAG
ncbi:hypothetical protein IVG45_04895 [Methylomonas sp. LL1]|uniref:hypothetical protein n=1 Tax=Methylomonas sp. LL1 TaxID=2785785 RepID=UPI0018C3E0F1|nr:hypothetical protein [Methylomonas sp. LL1]QPK64308.1 hypothetical protein IVG45_04895 [Methylomonas sp. LL1]